MNVITNNPVTCIIALAALQQVVDPEIELNIVDLGLIYQLDFDDDNLTIFVTMTLTTQFCPMGASITDAVKNVMENTFTAMKIIVTLTFQPAWNHDRISEEGKIFLNQ